MTDTVISVENLSKRYLIGHQAERESYTALRDVIARGAKNFARKAADLAHGRRLVQADTVEEFWALQDVSFDVKRGEVLGIIGRNGAGKSTLLKILSRITDPTSGRVRLAGRVASLLEVGTGFHPELTGRENIYLNGAILGMTRAEIRRKFDEIVAFAGVDKFLDTPVKRYSSGMYVRLAFAVAAHLEPEILVVDEVLAVGDAEFQKKCLGKMQEVAGRHGRTVLFVSHNLAAVQRLCSKVMWLRSGKATGMGDVQRNIEKYLADTQNSADRCLTAPLRINRTLEVTQLASTPNPVPSGSRVDLSLELFAREPIRITDLAILIYSSVGERISIIDFRGAGLPVALAADQTATMTCTVGSLSLIEGEYKLGFYIGTNHFSGNWIDIVKVNVGPKAQAESHSIYPAAYRGVLELDVLNKRVRTETHEARP